MSRKGRKISSSGFYHVINKGIGNQIMFEDTIDCNYFLKLLHFFKNKYCIKVIAYCLMENHFHLLIKDENNNISVFMQDLQSRYAEFFNKHHHRCGPLHNGRFQSEPVEDETYLRTVLRYIIKNPEKAGVSAYCEYKWSSFSEYFSNKHSSISDFQIVETLFANKKNFIKFLDITDNSSYLEIKTKFFFGIIDEDAIKYIHKKFNVLSCSLLRSFEKHKRNKAIQKLRKHGLSIRQIERLTGISKGIVQSISA